VTPMKVALTGGIGSGKSTVAALFAKLAAVLVLDLDQLGRDIAAPNTIGLQRLMDTFGHAFLQSDGTLNRAALAQHCFATASETAKLNAIMHPLIEQAENDWVRLQQSPYVIIEASVLLESGGDSRMDYVVVVLADEALRYQRVMARADRSAGDFYAIVERQCNDDKRRLAADFIIKNTHSLDTLKGLVAEAHQYILKQIKSRGG